MSEIPDPLVLSTPLTYRESSPAPHEPSVREICGVLTPGSDLEAGVGCAHQILSILHICTNSQNISASTVSPSLTSTDIVEAGRVVLGEDDGVGVGLDTG